MEQRVVMDRDRRRTTLWLYACLASMAWGVLLGWLMFG